MTFWKRMWFSFGEVYLLQNRMLETNENAKVGMNVISKIYKCMIKFMLYVMCFTCIRGLYSVPQSCDLHFTPLMQS